MTPDYRIDMITDFTTEVMDMTKKLAMERGIKPAEYIRAMFLVSATTFAELTSNDAPLVEMYDECFSKDVREYLSSAQAHKKHL